MANILMELGYSTGNIDTFEGIKHISRGKVETYPLPGCEGFEEARKFPERYRLWQGFSRSADTINKGDPNPSSDTQIILKKKNINKFKSDLIEYNLINNAPKS